MGKIWGLLDGKKTVISAVFYAILAGLRQGGVEIPPVVDNVATILAEIFFAVGMVHKGVKATTK
jgi:hypothetical protein